MGTAFLYQCSSCGYQTESSGKLDFGMVGVVEPFICSDCKELVDILICSIEEIQNQNPKTLLCSNCKSKNIIKWKTLNRPCPKCGGKMNKSGDLVIHWDQKATFA